MQEWKEEFNANHRWNRINVWFPDRDNSEEELIKNQEYEKINKLWEILPCLSDSSQKIMESIFNLEICNWNLEKSIESICKAIGTSSKPDIPIGHRSSLSDSRKKKIWAYYYAMQKWLTSKAYSSFIDIPLNYCDQDGAITKHIEEMLNESTLEKEYLVHYLGQKLLFNLLNDENQTEESPLIVGYHAKMKVLSNKIQTFDEKIKEIFEKSSRWNTLTFFQLCHYNTFRRLDIILSSIGVMKWRGAIPEIGNGGLRRAEQVAKYLIPLDKWLDDEIIEEIKLDPKISEILHSFLGEKTPEKKFLVALLSSLLRSQEIPARILSKKV